MSKLAVLVAMRRDMAFDFDRELRSVRDLIPGAQRISGKDYTIDLSIDDSYVSGSRARAAFAGNHKAALHETLLQYAHDLARESIELGISQSTVDDALGGERLQIRRDNIASASITRRVAEQTYASSENGYVRLAAISA